MFIIEYVCEHGASFLCAHLIDSFSMVGDFLQEKYGIATKVKPTKKGRLKLHKADSRVPTANDLVFIKSSPDYCHHNQTIGSLGRFILTRLLPSQPDHRLTG